MSRLADPMNVGAVATYDYVNADGSQSYRVTRHVTDAGKKTFIQWHWNGRQWLNGLNGATPLPYRLPETLAADEAGRIVYLVEGEKDADNGARFGLDTTCNNGGAGHWGAAQSAYLQGANVVIVPDNDEPIRGKETPGERHVRLAGKHLHGVAASVRIARLPKVHNGQPVKDLSDFIAAGGTRAEFDAIVTDAPEYVPPMEVIAAPRPQYVPKEGDGDRLHAYASRALDGAINDLASTTSGRFAALEKVAMRLGNLYAANWTGLTESECLTALYGALDSNGYAAKVTQRTAEYRAREYFKYGQKTPADAPELTDRALPGAETVEGVTFATATALHTGKPLRDNARSALLNIAEGFALIGELMAATGVGVHRPATVAELVAASESQGAALSVKTIRRSLAWAVFKGIVNELGTQTDTTPYNSTASSVVGESVVSVCVPNYPGRPSGTFFQLADPDALLTVFRHLAEDVTVLRCFADQDILPMPTATVLIAAGVAPDVAAQAAVKLTEDVKPLIEAQCRHDKKYTFADAKAKADADIVRYMDCMAASGGGSSFGAPYPTLRAYKTHLLKRWSRRNEGKPGAQKSDKYLAAMVNCDRKSIAGYLDDAGVKSDDPAPIVTTAPKFRAVGIARRAASPTPSRFARYDLGLKATPVAVFVENVRYSLLSQKSAQAALTALDESSSVNVRLELIGDPVRRMARTEELPDITAAKDSDANAVQRPVKTDSTDKVNARTNKASATADDDPKPFVDRVSRRLAAKLPAMAHETIRRAGWRLVGDQLIDRDGELWACTPDPRLANMLGNGDLAVSDIAPVVKVVDTTAVEVSANLPASQQVIENLNEDLSRVDPVQVNAEPCVELWPLFATAYEQVTVAMAPVSQYAQLVARVEACMSSGDKPRFEDIEVIAGVDPNLFTTVRRAFGKDFDQAFHRWWFAPKVKRAAQDAQLVAVAV